MGKLERAYSDVLGVIGVQTPKYPAEGVPANLVEAVQRLGITHPVVNDPEYRVWDAYAVKAWPTLIFISPDGLVIGDHSGEAPYEALDSVMTALITQYEEAGVLRRGPLPYPSAAFTRSNAELSFPGKVLATADRLFIADSGHNRLLMADHDGTVRQLIGTGEAGFQDGDQQTARFQNPQGMALLGDTLYIADADNHALRTVDLSTGQVATVAGTGEQARRAVRSGPARAIDLSSPWDVAVAGEDILIAMAGLHQIWSYDRHRETVAVWAGSGHEGIQNGPRERAWLAQPMGIVEFEESVYVACAETQAVQRIDAHSGQVSTVVGRGLFAFGDEDGPNADALLQHTQDVAAGPDALYIADTYNNKIKCVNPDTGIVSTLAGSGPAGVLDGPGEGARLAEPGGVSLHGDTLWVADTNNHLIRSIDLASGHIRTLALGGSGIEVRAG